MLCSDMISKPPTRTEFGGFIMEEMNYENLKKLIDEGNFSFLRHELSEMNEVDIAEFLGELDRETMIKVFRILPKDISADVFAYLESEDQGDIISSITDTEIKKLVDELFLDDVVDLVEEVPANLVTRILKNATPETRKLINTYLSYPDDSAGSIMTNEMVELHDRLTVSEAIDHIRRTGIDKETIYPT